MLIQVCAVVSRRPEATSVSVSGAGVIRAQWTAQPAKVNTLRDCIVLLNMSRYHSKHYLISVGLEAIVK